MRGTRGDRESWHGGTSHPASPRRPRSVPYIVAGSVLTLGAVAVLGVTFVKIRGRVPVLVVDQALQVGQVTQADDLKVVDIAPGTLSDWPIQRDDRNGRGVSWRTTSSPPEPCHHHSNRTLTNTHQP